MLLVVLPVSACASIPIDEVNFPDANLRSFISSVWDHGYADSDGKWVGVHDGFLTATEIPDVTSLNWYGPTNAKGIEYFPNLEQILCQTGTLTELNVSSFSRLKNLFCDENRLTRLDVSSNYALVKLQCYSNKIESLNVSHNHELELLICVDNPLGKLDVSQNSKLQVLRCGSTDLHELDVTKNLLLTELDCWGNHLTELDLSKNTRLTTVKLGVQEVNGLKVKKVPEGYQICLKDYVSNVENIEISRVGINNYKSGRLLSYDGITGNVIFDECPRTLHYFYRTHSPNNDLLYVEVKASMAVDVIERGGPTENIIFGIGDNSYLDILGDAITEASIAGLSARKYGKKGFVADGNSRLIVRVQTQRPGNVTFSVKENIGVEVESLIKRTKLTASTHVQTSSIGRDGYQASAVLVAPEEYPSWGSHEFPSENFTVHVKFTADDTGENLTEEEREIEEDITLEIHAAPVLLIHSLGGNNSAIGTFYDGRTETFDQYSRGRGVFNALMNAGFGIHLYGSNSNYSMFNEIASVLEEYNRNDITCTKIDLVGYGMGGLVARCFCVPDKPMDDGNYYTVRSYRQGMVRRIITIGTPHQGTPWADYMLNNISMWDDINLNSTTFNDVLGQAVHRMIIKAVLNAMMFLDTNTSRIWSDMASTSPFVRTPFPSNVPMYAIYGDVSSTLNNIVRTIDAFSVLWSLNKLVRFAEGIQKLLSGEIKTTEALRAFWETSLRNASVNDRAGFSLSNIGTALQYSGILDSHPIVTTLLQAGLFILSPVQTSIVEMLKGPFNFINKTMFHGEPHDMFVSASSAQGDIVGHSSRAEGWQYRNSSIYKQDEIGEAVASLLKGDKSRFGVLTRNNTANYAAAPNTAILRSSSDEDTETIEDYFVQKLTLSATPATLNIRSTGRLTLSAVSDVQLEDDVYVLLKKDGNEKLFIIASRDKSNFEAEIEFTSRDAGIIDAYCFTRGDGTNIYTSNTVRIVIKADTEISGLAFANDSGVIFMEVGSEVNSELTATAQDGTVFDVSSPAMGTVWTSSTPSAAYVTDDGMIHTQADGSTVLTAKYHGLTASILVNVGEIAAPKILTESLDNASLLKQYSADLTASGSGPMYWRVISGHFPIGLELSDTGRLSGSPKEAGKFTVTVHASNIAGSDERELTITVEDKSKEIPKITSQPLPNATAGLPYSAEIAATGGGIVWSASGLPSGLSFEDGIISGTPAKAGTFEVTISAVNSLGQAKIVLPLFVAEKPSECAVDEETFPDKVFRAHVSSHFDLNSDDILDAEEIAFVTEINVEGAGITSLEGIENFTALVKLSCSLNNLTYIDTSANSALEELYCNNNSLRLLDVSSNKRLKILEFSGNSISAIDLSACTELHTLSCMHNSFAALDISGLALWNFYCGQQYVRDTPITLEKRFDFGTVGLASKDLSRISGLSAKDYLGQSVDINYDQSSGTVTFGTMPSVLTYTCSVPYKKLGWNEGSSRSTEVLSSEAMNVSIFFTAVYAPSITTSALPAGKVNKKYTALLEANGGGISWSAEGLPSGLTLKDGAITGTPKAHGTFSVKVTASNMAGSVSAVFKLEIGGRSSATTIDEHSFPDVNLRQFIRENFDTNGDGIISSEETENIRGIDITRKGITSLEGLEIFTNIEIIDCSYNNLRNLDVTPFTSLKWLACSNNLLTSLDVSANNLLVVLHCTENFITKLDLSDNPDIEELYCWSNDIHTLILGDSPKLARIHCHDNPLGQLDVTDCPELLVLYCWNCGLESIDISNCEQLISFDIAINRIESLDVSRNKSMKYLCVNENPLKSIDLSNNTALEELLLWMTELEVLDLRSCRELAILHCSDSRLTSLTMGSHENLRELHCNNNQISILDVSQCPALEVLYCYINRLADLNVNQCPDLNTLNCADNDISVLNVHNCAKLLNLGCDAGTEIIRNYNSASFLWDGFYSRASIIGGKTDFSGASFSHIMLVVKGDNPGTEELMRLPGIMTLTGGNYTLRSFADDSETERVSDSVNVLPISPDYEVGEELYSYLPAFVFLPENETGLNGVHVSWIFTDPKMSSMNGQFRLPEFKTTQEQLNSCVPYIEYNYSGSKVEGLTWRLVRQADTSVAAAQGCRVSVNIEVHNSGGEKIFDGHAGIFAAGEAPEGVVSFVNAVEASEISEVKAYIWVEDGQPDYVWIFDAGNSEPALIVHPDPVPVPEPDSEVSELYAPAADIQAPTVRETIINALRALSQTLSSIINNDTEISALPKNSTGSPRTIDDVSNEELAAITASEDVAVVFPIMSVDKDGVYAWGVTLDSLEAGAVINLYLFVEEGNILRASAHTREAYVFLDDDGMEVTTVPENKHVNIAAFMEAGKTYVPILTAASERSSVSSTIHNNGGCSALGTGAFITIAILFLKRRRG